MKLVQASCFFILIVSMIGCTSEPNKAELNNNNLALNEETHFCEIIYAPHPHKTAINAIGAERLNKTLSLSFTGMVQVSEAFIPMTQALIEEVIAEDNASIALLGHDVMLGGYEGESIPSVVIKTKFTGEENTASLLKIAAEIGFIYAQDSVLVICDYQVDSAFHATTSVELTDQGRKSFIDENSAPLLFGMMIGAHNGVENLGYSYFKDTKVFSTFVDLASADKEMLVINDLVSWLQELSQGEVSLNVTAKPIWIFFPHNKWSINQQGQGFYPYLDANDINKKLMDKRQLFLNKMDNVLAEIE